MGYTDIYYRDMDIRKSKE